MQIDMNDVGRFFLFFRTRWTIGKYKISRSFDSHSNRFSGSMSGSKSQHKNKDKAFGVLRSRLYEQELAKKQAEDTKRTSQVSSGDRSNKILTIMHKVV
jgi:hypothetical protein